MPESQWHDLGPIEEFAQRPLTPVVVGRTRLAITHLAGQFGVLSGVCNHAGGSLGEGRLDGEYVTCPWHNWKYHFQSGLGEPGFEADAVPRYQVRMDGGRLWVDLASATKRTKGEHAPQPLARKIERAAGEVRVVGISTTNMDAANPRYSTSEALLVHALDFAASQLGVETRLIRLNDLKFRNCEGYYSKSAHACTWPCSITQMDPTDQMDQVYEAVVHWADVILLSTPIRWGNASSLYYKMIERMNCIQNQVTIANRVMLRNKVASFIITGGQDNVQAVAGQLLGFFAELGCYFPQFPYIAHSRGWSAEDMENNVRAVQQSTELREGAEALLRRSVELARRLLATEPPKARIERGGRKAHRLVLPTLQPA